MTKKQMPDRLWEMFSDLSDRLSPENLHQDGEISVEEAEEKYDELMMEWRRLEKIIGLEVSEDEVWDWQDKQMAAEEVE